MRINTGDDAPSNDTGQHRQVRLLIKEALEAPTPKQLTDFIDFSSRFRRLAIWNARMAYIQRPGACIIGSEHEWIKVGRYVRPDAVPIIILWPFSPIRFVYELEDTGPPIDRDKINDPFAVRGRFEHKALPKLIAELQKQKKFTVIVEARPQGFDRAGSISTSELLERPAFEGEERIGDFVKKNADQIKELPSKEKPLYRMVVNDRMNPSEQFVTIAHELGHVFCGHLGASQTHTGQGDESGWPDRRSLNKNEREVEAEAVAFLVALRAGLITRSAQYLMDYAKGMNIKTIDIDRIVRAAARIERLAEIRHGTLEFN